MPKIWKLKPEIPVNIAENLSQYPKLAGQLLYNRGLINKDEIADFLEPKYENLPSPFLFGDMEKAVERIWRAIEEHQPICIYGDYDADAVTANAVLGQTFRYLGVEASPYIPDRFTEGYGVNIEALKKIRDDGAKIIITVDCGTNSVDAAGFCAENNIDLIITDHHEIIGELPKAYAVINPKNPADKYPYREITGVGVAFKLACGLLSKHEKVTTRLSSRNFLPKDNHQSKNIRDPEQSAIPDPGSSLRVKLRRTQSEAGMEHKDYTGGYEKWLLDLVAIGTVADCHSLLGENRILVKYGLKVLAKTKWVGLRALMLLAGLDPASKPLDTYSLGFIIAPRLNAAGRLEHASIALDLLLETNFDLAKEKAQNLEAINTRRQGLTASVLSEAKEKVIMLKERKVLALVGEGWPKGIMGLVAGKLAEEFYKPTIVLERTLEVCTGSARTAGEFDILEALKFSSGHLLKFGGHRQAAGLSLQAENFEVFYQKVLEYADLNITAENSQKVLELEAELLPEDLSLVTCQLLRQLEPFGVNNPHPKFLVPNLKIESTRTVGKQNQHLQMQLSFNDVIARRSASDLSAGALAKVGDEAILSSKERIATSAGQSPGLLAMTQKIIPAIMFNCGDFAKTLKIGDTVDAAAELIEDGWNGRKDIKLKIIDLRKTT